MPDASYLGCLHAGRMVLGLVHQSAERYSLVVVVLLIPLLALAAPSSAIIPASGYGGTIILDPVTPDGYGNFSGDAAAQDADRSMDILPGARESGRVFSISSGSPVPVIHSLVLPGLPEAGTQQETFCSDLSTGDTAGSLCYAGQQIGIAVTPGGRVRVAGTNGSFTLHLDGIGRPGEFQIAGFGKIRASAGRLDILRPGYTEWYTGSSAGIEQGMTVESRPVGNGTLIVNYTLAGNLRPALAGETLVFFDVTGPVMQYGGLAAYDATGRNLPVALSLSSDTLTWQVDDQDAVYPVVIDPWIATQDAVLTATDAATGAKFGSSVGIAGDTAIVGAYGASVGTKTSAGQAYVFTKSGGVWSQTAILNATDAAKNAYFGSSLAVSGDGNTMVIGAPGAAVGTNTSAGQVYVFQNSGSTWYQSAILNATDAAAGDNFGSSAAISDDGNTVLLGAVGYASYSGKAYVFKNSGGTWNQAAVLTDADPDGSMFGDSIAISDDGTLVVIATPSDDTTGHVSIFTESGGSWSPAASPADTDSNDYSFGTSVGLSDDKSTMFIGAYNETHAGKEYVFINSGAAWSQAAVLEPADVSPDDYFGTSVAVYGDTAIIGAYKFNSDAGRAYAFKNTGSSWNQAAVLEPTDSASGAYFGKAVSVSGNTAVIGAYQFNSYTGKAYIFTLSSASSGPAVTGINPASGLNATEKTVTVSGTNFDTSASPVVKFTRTGSPNVTLDVVSDTGTALVRKVPADIEAGAWNVTVVNRDGEEGTNASVTYTALSSPRLTGISPVYGGNATVTLVTITGSQFGTAAAPNVNLTRSGYGNITLTGTNLSTTSFTVSVPQDIQAGIWGVTVINPDGLEGTNSSVTYLALAPPRLTGISPAFGANATATLVTITGSLFNSTAGTPVVNLTSAGKSTVTLTATNLSATSFTVTVPNHNIEAVWNVTVINPDGLEGTNASITFSTTDPPPVTEFSFDPATGLAPLAVTFTDQSINVPESWSWDFGDGDTTGSTLQNPVHTYTKPGIYTVTLSATNGLGTGNKTVQKGIAVTALADETAILNASSDSAANARFGASVAISSDGNTAFVGSEYTTLGSTPAGKAYVFKKNAGAWSRSAVLLASNAAASDAFGRAIALSRDGTTAAIAADNANIGAVTWAGQVYIFTNNGGTWSQSAILNASDYESSGHFGKSLSLSDDGNTLFIGSYMATVGGDDSAGKTYIFQRSGGVWSGKQTLVASNPETGANFGTSVSFKGDTAVIGAPRATASSIAKGGQVYVFTDSGGTWSQTAILKASDVAGESHFGESVALADDADTVFIGASYTTVGTTEYSGKAYAFERSGGTWSQATVMSAPEATHQAYFGDSVATSGDGSRVLVSNIGKGSDPGLAYIYQKYGGSWYRTHVLKASDATGYDGFGWSTALGGATALVGAAWAASGPTAEAGQAYFFTISDPAPVVAGISPAYSLNTTAITVSVSGTNFATASDPVVTLTRSGYADVTLGVVSGTSTALVRTVPASVTAGTWNIVVTNPDGQQGTSASVTYTAGVVIPPPSITAVTPATGVNTSAVSTVISGTGFNTTMAGATTVNLTRTGYTNISVTGVTPESATSITVSLPISHADAGIWYLVVINPDGQENTESILFRITDPGTLIPPSVSSVSPAMGLNTGPVSAIITGTGFNTTGAGGTTVNLTQTGYANISVTNVTPASATSIAVSLPITHGGAGTWYLVVINPDGQESVERVPFVITGPVPTTAPVETPPASYGSDDDGPTVQKSLPVKTISVNIGGNSNTKKAVVTGTGLDDLILTGTVLSVPELNRAAPPGVVFQYISLVPAQYVTITGAAITFTVPQSWLDENHVSPQDIILYHYTGGQWVALPTTVVKTENGQVYFTATTPSFSWFAIGVTKTPSAVVTSGIPGSRTFGDIVGGAVTEPVTAGTGAGTLPAETTATVPVVAVDPGFPLATIAMISTGCVVLIGGSWYVRRWWIRRQNPALFMEYD